MAGSLRPRNHWGWSPRVYLTVAALVALLPAVAVLQYRWIGQVSEAERERMQAGLRRSMALFAAELHDRLRRLVEPLHRTPEETAPEYAQRTARWLQGSAEGRLVRSVYLISIEAEPSLARLNAGTGELEPAQWPAHLRELRIRLLDGGRPGQPRRLPVVTADGAPVFLLPWLRSFRPGPPFPPLSRRGPEAFVAAELDLGRLRNDLLPTLAARHFGDDYAVRLVSRAEPPRVIYSSAESPARAPADGSIALLDILPEPPAGVPFGRGPMRAGRPPDAGPWQLLAWHRSGSLEAVVQQARRRNLAVSAAALLLMAGGVLLLVVATRRAQRLAHLQIEFVAGVSHELRTPLAVICSAADNLADGLVRGEEQTRRYGSLLRKEGRRLANMVEQILGLAGIRSGRVQYALHPVGVEAVINAAIADCAPEARSDWTVEKTVEAELPPVMADAAALAQCVRNLVSNALAYAGGGGWVGVSARAVRNNGRREVEIAVTDHGRGIDPEDLPHIFEPFYRGRDALSRQTAGAGIGLSLVKSIVEAHGGSVSVSSKAGEGATFTLRLPAGTHIEVESGTAHLAG